MNRTTTVMLIITALALLLVAGCASKGTTGYATYSGNSQPAAGGGGGCGRFASTSADACADAGTSAEEAEAALGL